jgi:hypothetical protein
MVFCFQGIVVIFYLSASSYFWLWAIKTGYPLIPWITWYRLKRYLLIAMWHQHELIWFSIQLFNICFRMMKLFIWIKNVLEFMNNWNKCVSKWITFIFSNNNWRHWKWRRRKRTVFWDFLSNDQFLKCLITPCQLPTLAVYHFQRHGKLIASLVCTTRKQSNSVAWVCEWTIPN